MKEPKITLDTVRLAAAFAPGAHLASPGAMQAIRDAADLERMGRRVKALNTQYANTGSDKSERAADRWTCRAHNIAVKYGAKFSRFGRGSGLWPLVEADGKDFSL